MNQSAAPVIGFDEASHTYTLDGKPVPGCTSVLDPLYDFRFVSEEDLERARDKGKKVHKTVELFEAGTLNRAKLDPVLDRHLVQWEKFKVDFRYLPLAHEVFVASRKYQFCGQLDNHGLLLPLLPTDLEEDLLLDIKTGAEYEPHMLQTAGYKIAAVEMGLLPASTKRASLYLDEDGYRFRFHSGLNDTPAFLSLLTIAHWRKFNGKK